jgi:hypothetical protein
MANAAQLVEDRRKDSDKLFYETQSGTATHFEKCDSSFSTSESKELMLPPVRACCAAESKFLLAKPMFLLGRC